MIDTHLHILPAVDDGPETVQESLTFETLLKKGLIHCIASDAHGLHRRPPGVIAGLQRATALVGQAHVYQMTEIWPAAIVNNKVLLDSSKRTGG